jgi:hypothetical protein
VRQRLDTVMAAARDSPRTAVEIAPRIHDEPLTERNASWVLSETLCYLQHLERQGKMIREPDGDAARWRAT